jgi:hypothetical protein
MHSSPLERGTVEGDSPVRSACNAAMRAVFRESGCLGVQPKRGGIRHPRLNISERPIANKYCEGKLKSTLERESNEHVKLLAGKRWASVRTLSGTGLGRWSAAAHDVRGCGAAGTGCMPGAWVSIGCAHCTTALPASLLWSGQRAAQCVRPRNAGRPQGRCVREAGEATTGNSVLVSGRRLATRAHHPRPTDAGEMASIDPS